MPLRDRLADRAFLFDHPNSYLAGVDAAIHAIADQRQEALGGEPPAAHAPQPRA
jgi:hypothetical protein